MKKPYSCYVGSDQGDEFDSNGFEIFCNENGFIHNFSALRTP